MTTPTGLTQPQNSSTTASGLTAPEGTAVLPAAPPAPPAEFRFGADVAPWMQGRTPAEVDAQARELATLAAQALANAPAIPPAQNRGQQAPPGPQIDPSDYLTGATALELGNHWRQQTLQETQGMMAPALNMMATNSLEMVKREFPEEFQRYSPEITTTLSQIPKTGWTIDNIRQVVRMTQASHLDEIVRHRAAKLAAQDPDALRSTGAPGAPPHQPPAGPDAALNDAQRLHLRRNGMTPELVAQMAAKSGKTAQEWYTMYAKHAVGDAV